jgi:hypothetical protein
MKTILVLTLSLIFSGTICFAQTSTQPSTQEPSSQNAAQTPPASHFPAGTLIPAELSKSLDAKKTKPGDKVEAKTATDLLSHGQIVLPRNTKITGHVTEAKPYSKESPDSMVGIAFDRIAMKNGQEMPFQAAIQAIARPLQSAALPQSGPMADSAGMPPGSSPNQAAPVGPGGSPSAAQGADMTPQFPAGGASGSSGATVSPLGPTSQGVVGMNGLALNSTPQASVVSSSNANVHLESGTQLMLRTE